MAVSRYNNLLEFINSTSGYRKSFKGRYGEQGIRQTGVNQLLYPNQQIYDSIETAAVTWKVGDRFYKLSSKYYNNPEYWWVIAWFNKKPTEQHIELGETILVPLFLDELLSIIGL
jgi:hypothetical protein|tara:strand:+ start:176 stop:520 length:345 start_codon:yes stop_codon:yes gene_type:complete